LSEITTRDIILEEVREGNKRIERKTRERLDLITRFECNLSYRELLVVIGVLFPGVERLEELSEVQGQELREFLELHRVPLSNRKIKGKGIF